MSFKAIGPTDISLLHTLHDHARDLRKGIDEALDCSGVDFKLDNNDVLSISVKHSHYQGYYPGHEIVIGYWTCISGQYGGEIKHTLSHQEHFPITRRLEAIEAFIRRAISIRPEAVTDTSYPLDHIFVRAEHVIKSEPQNFHGNS